MPRFPQILTLLVGLALVAGCHHLRNREAIAELLPPDVHLDTVASCDHGGYNKITVEDELIRLQAQRGKDGKLCDGSGKPITFFRLTGFGGTPPGTNEQLRQILDEEERSLQALRKTYTVITLTCNPSGIRPAGQNNMHSNQK